MPRVESIEHFSPLAGGAQERAPIPQRREILRSRRDTVVVAPKTELAEFYYSLPRLAGTDVRYSRAGDIFHTRYRSIELPRPEVAEHYRVFLPRVTKIGNQPVSEEEYLRELARGRHLRHRKYVEQLVVMQITDDEGSVEAAIRAQEHILYRYLVPKGEPDERGERIRLAKEVMDAVLELYDIYAADEFNQRKAQDLTQELMRKYHLERASSKFMQKLTKQLVNASRGTDSLDRFNPTIMTSILGSVFIKAMREEEKADLIRAKFMANLVALRDERRVSREMMELVATEVGSKEKIAGHDSLLRPEHGITRLQIRVISGKINILCSGLAKIKLKPYRPVAVSSIDQLQDFNKLLGRAALREIKEKGVLPQVHRGIRDVLDRYHLIHPPEEEKDRTLLYPP